MKRQILIGLVLLITSTAFGQNFEGWITYKIEMENPYPGMMPDSIWQESIKKQWGERGYMVQKYFYKNGDYISEIEIGKQNGYQAYNPKDGLLYSWQEDSDTAITLNSKKYMDEFIEIVHPEKTDTIFNILCKSIVVKSKMGEMTLWYNSSYFKMDPKYYIGHIYGHWEQILEEIGCLPLKMEQASLTQTIIDFKEEAIDKNKFTIPTFKEIIVNPIN